MKKKIIACALTILIALTCYMLSPINDKMLLPGTWERRLSEHNFEEIIPKDDSDPLYVSYSEFRSEMGTEPNQVLSQYGSKFIRFDTADELYRFSVDVCFLPDVVYPGSEKLTKAMIDVLLSLNYVLGCDIDYSVMKSKAFIPVGFSFGFETAADYSIFTGTFDGRGFEIKNLYVADYPFLHFIDENDEHIVTTNYYAMFTYNRGTIKNLGLVNPTLELTEEHPDLEKASNLVGYNMAGGTVEHVYVIDDRSENYAGIRMSVPFGQTTSSYSAAGIVHTNEGELRDAYYVSRYVVNRSYINNFSVEPIVMVNEGYEEEDDLVYDSELYAAENKSGKTTPPIGVGETTFILKNSSSLGDDWYYYPADGYPSLQGLRYVDGKYLIEDAVDFVVFGKLLTLNSVLHDRVFHGSDYLLVSDIDMDEVAPGAYTTPSVEFQGTLSGRKEEDGEIKNHYIHNLKINNGVFVDNNLYSGLFSILTGKIEYITFSKAKIELTDSDAYYSSFLYIGIVAGQLLETKDHKGEISHVSANVEIDLGDQAISEVSAGLLVGAAQGTITSVYTKGKLEGGNHTFTSSQEIAGEYKLGGVVGSTSGTLRLGDALNKGAILGVGSNTSANSIGDACIYVGGIIGHVANPSKSSHFALLTNEGRIELREFVSTHAEHQFIGGIFGLSEGSAYALDSDFGLWTNRGELDVSARGVNPVHAAGILNSRHSEQTEFIYLYNEGPNPDGSGSTIVTDDFANLKYTTLIYDYGTAGVVLSQSSNSSDCELEGYAQFSGVFHSENGAPSVLRFVENEGKIIFKNQNLPYFEEGPTDVIIAGITLSENVNYLSVYFSGVIGVYTVTSGIPIWISGITWTLTKDYYLKDSINKGKIFFADIDAEANSYLAGLVNINNSGDLNTGDARPRATKGIINSVNYCDITSTLENDLFDLDSSEKIYGIESRGNTFAGGIVTLNRGSIQDTLNLGNLKLANTSPVSDDVIFDPNDTTGGMAVSAYYGIIAGGIAAAAADGNSKIFDSANSGDIIAQSRNFARAGGVLALCLYVEMAAADVGKDYYADDIDDSILSNCINYGDVSSVTKAIATYSNHPTSQTFAYYYGGSQNGGNVTITTTEGTNERPGVYASAGGVIGYGLSTMRRMINHGKVSSTDVAGGIVGATFVYQPGTTSSTTVVNIDTAINYGSVWAVKTSYFDFNPGEDYDYDLDYENLAAFFYDYDDPEDREFIFPTTISDIRKFPEGKRGIGGIFGRLQRARNHTMSGEASQGGKFTYIVNMDKNVDLIGRLDQVYNFTSSMRFFVFPRNQRLFYSAKPNDTTQAVFTGVYYYELNTSVQITGQYTLARYTYTSSSRPTRYYETLDYYRDNVKYNYSGTLYVNVGGSTTSISSIQLVEDRPDLSQWVNHYSNRQVSSMGTNRTEPLDPPLPYSDTTSISRNARYRMGDAIEVPLITVDPEEDGEFIYDSSFIMRTDSSLQEYIYYVESEVLSDRFREENEFGMYVLATSSGSTYGATLPSNVDLTKTYPLGGRIPYNVDYENVDPSYRAKITEEDGYELEERILVEYRSLLQTRYNDKSELLTVNQDFSLEEIGGSETILLNPTINPSQKTITFDLNLRLINSSQSVTYFRIRSALLPANAIIAEKWEEYGGGYADLMAKLRGEIEAGLNISQLIPPELQIDLSGYQNITQTTQVLLGNFVSYSQASVNDATYLLDNKYQTEYQVYLNLRPRAAVPQASQYSVDGGPLTSFPANATISGEITSNLRVTFTDSSQILPVGFSIAPYISLYFTEGQNDALVLDAYYDLTVVPVRTNHTFEFTLVLSEDLRGGSYAIKYKFFATDVERTINITKAKSTAVGIINLEHYSFADFQTFTGTSFTTYVNFGYPLDLSGIDFEVIEEETEPYLEGKTYRLVLAGENEADRFFTAFQIPRFAELVEVRFDPATGKTFANGYIVYTLEYTIKPETGDAVTYTHHIREREISLEGATIYKDNNRVPYGNLFCTREASSTKFSIDFGIDQKYAGVVYNLYQDNPAAYFAFQIRLPNGTVVNEANGIAFSADNYLNIFFLYESLPGEYVFTITYHRWIDETEGVISFAGEEPLSITKNKGVSAYLKDIRFSQSMQDTRYPNIYVTDEDGNIVDSEYTPRVYFGGIDYDGSEGNCFHFFINGYVANIPLDYYMPLFLDFLPAGATIARMIYPIEAEYGTVEWTPEVDGNSPQALKERLAFNFTINPYTGAEPGEDEVIFVTYRVTSEEKSEGKKQEVYYHIAVTDVSYNVTLMFNVYYEVNGTLIPAAESPLLGKVFLINVRNFNTDLPVGEVPIEDVDAFPEFTVFVSNNNRTFMFYHVSPSDYSLRFGRNLSGFFAIAVELPDVFQEHGLEYRIEYNGKALKDLAEYGIEGKYFYIHASERLRTRYLDIIITPAEKQSEGWGLFDLIRSWFK